MSKWEMTQFVSTIVVFWAWLCKNWTQVAGIEISLEINWMFSTIFNNYIFMGILFLTSLCQNVFGFVWFQGHCTPGCLLAIQMVIALRNRSVTYCTAIQEQKCVQCVSWQQEFKVTMLTVIALSTNSLFIYLKKRHFQFINSAWIISLLVAIYSQKYLGNTIEF